MNIIITGASRGMGKAIAEIFAGDKQAHTLFLSARNETALKITAENLAAQFPHHIIHYKAADLSRKENAETLAAWALSIAVPDIVINNAGTFIPGNTYNEPAGTLENMLAVNLYSAYHFTRSLLPKMIKNKRGHIFNICSIASLEAYSNGGAYSISKFALAGFTKNLREEMKSFGKKVTGVYPGATMTDSWSGSGVAPERIMEANDIAKMIHAAAYLSPQAVVEDIVLRPHLGDL
jgi:short-subunit dehydrogenase